MTLYSHLSKVCIAGAWVLSATLALALPTPKEIESAVNAGHYTQAESMLREVLQEKPQSAKAHYELGQVLAHAQRYKEAQTELQKAKDIDPSLKFATSPEKFNAVWAKVNDLASAPSSSVVMAPSAAPGTHAGTQVVPAATSAPAASGGGFSLTYVWLAIAGLVVLGLWLRRSATSAPLATPAAETPVQRGFGAQYTPNAAPTYGPQGYAPQGYAQSNTGGSTMAGAVVGGLAGMAAGYALSKALEGDHTSSGAASAPSHATASGNGGYVPFDAPAQPDLGGFDAGSGSDWDSTDAGGGSDDSW